MKKYVYVGSEDYLCPITSPKTLVKSGQVIEVSDLQDRKLDKRLFKEMGKDMSERIKHLEDKISQMETSVANTIKSMREETERKILVLKEARGEKIDAVKSVLTETQNMEEMALYKEDSVFKHKEEKKIKKKIK